MGFVQRLLCHRRRGCTEPGAGILKEEDRGAQSLAAKLLWWHLPGPERWGNQLQRLCGQGHSTHRLMLMAWSFQKLFVVLFQSKDANCCLTQYCCNPATPWGNSFLNLGRLFMPVNIHRRILLLPCGTELLVEFSWAHWKGKRMCMIWEFGPIGCRSLSYSPGLT